MFPPRNRDWLCEGTDARPVASTDGMTGVLPGSHDKHSKLGILHDRMSPSKGFTT